MLISDVVSQFEQLVKNNDFFEFYWIPHTKWALTKANNITNLPADPPARFSTWMHKIVLENIAFGLLCRIGRLVPSLIPRFATLLPGAGRVEFVIVSHRVFSSKRLVKFYEMEYSISINAVGSALNEIMQMIEQRNLKISFPIEVRCTGADDIPLSTSTGRESAYIAVHMYQGCDYDEYFKAVEEILVRYVGRPHWGKIHYMDGTQLSSLYPEYQRFIEVRNQLDPEGVFTNDYLRRVLGR
jgi:FAD/FMN-containing dehydrogenase